MNDWIKINVCDLQNTLPPIGKSVLVCYKPTQPRMDAYSYQVIFRRAIPRSAGFLVKENLENSYGFFFDKSYPVAWKEIDKYEV